MNSHTKRCPLVEKAEELVSQIEAQELPADFDPSGSYNQILAHVRHEYTNYESLLRALPACRGPECDGYDEIGNECLQKIIAHDTLKWAAKAEAEAIYQRGWQERQKSKSR